MKNLKLGEKERYYIDEKIIKKYNIKAGDVSPFTRLKVIDIGLDEEDDEIDIKDPSTDTGVDIKEVATDTTETDEIDIKEPSPVDEIDIVEVRG